MEILILLLPPSLTTSLVICKKLFVHVLNLESSFTGDIACPTYNFFKDGQNFSDSSSTKRWCPCPSFLKSGWALGLFWSINLKKSNPSKCPTKKNKISDIRSQSSHPSNLQLSKQPQLWPETPRTRDQLSILGLLWSLTIESQASWISSLSWFWWWFHRYVHMCTYKLGPLNMYSLLHKLHINKAIKLFLK